MVNQKTASHSRYSARCQCHCYCSCLPDPEVGVVSMLLLLLLLLLRGAALCLPALLGSWAWAREGATCGLAAQSLTCCHCHCCCCCQTQSWRMCHCCCYRCHCYCSSCLEVQPCVGKARGCHDAPALPGSQALAACGLPALGSARRGAPAACCVLHRSQRGVVPSSRPCCRHPCRHHTCRSTQVSA